MKQYVLGFMFNGPEVLLINKNRPEFQKGRKNGIGGKVEHLERPDDAMVREFREETGLQTKREDWQLKIILQGEEFKVLVFKSYGDIGYAQTTTDEVVEIARVFDLPSDVMPNLKWQVPILLDDEIKNVVTVEYR